MAIRLGGLATGIDTDTVIKQMLVREQTKIDKVSASKQVLQWQQESYRDFSTAIKGFKDKYFDILNKQSYALSNDFFSSMAAKITGVDSGSLGVTASNTAKQGKYTVNVTAEAKGAKLQTGKDQSNNEIRLTGTDKLTSSIKIKTGDMGEFVEIGNGIEDADGKKFNIENINDLVKAINSDSRLKGKVTANFSDISGKFTLETVGTGGSKSLEVSGGATSTLGLSGSGSGIVVASLKIKYNQMLPSAPIKVGVDLAGKDTKLSALEITNGIIKIGNTEIDVLENDTIDDLMIKIKAEGYTAEFDESTGRISIVSADGDNATSNEFTITGDSSDNLSKLGFSNGGKSISIPKINYEAKSVDKIDGIKINGDKVKKGLDGTVLNSKGVAIDGLTYKEEADGKYTITSTKGEFNISDSGITNTNSGAIVAIGQDSKIEVTIPGDTTKYEITNSKNSFTLDGITFDIKGEGTVDFTVEPNVDKAVENIKGFVNAYNELIDSIGSTIYQKKQYTYSPLTDEQKEAMTEAEIKTWETKAKQGILRNDSSLNKFLEDLRSTFYVNGETGAGSLSLKDIGIGTTSDYTNRGKLEINEEKLREALKNNPDGVSQMFTRQEGTYNADKGYSASSERTKGSGIFARISDVIQDTIRTTRNSNNKKGSLLEKAGIKGDTTDTENLVTKDIKAKDTMLYDLKRKMQERETQLYKQFAYLEKMTNNYNTQSSWLTQQLG